MKEEAKDMVSEILERRRRCTRKSAQSKRSCVYTGLSYDTIQQRKNMLKEREDYAERKQCNVT
jgi:hypothetical protein